MHSDDKVIFSYVASVCYLAEHGSYNGWSMALEETLLIDGVIAQHVPNHQEERGHAVPFQTALWWSEGERKRSMVRKVQELYIISVYNVWFTFMEHYK